MNETETQSILEAVQGVNHRLDTVDGRLVKIETRLDMIDRDLSDLKDEVKTWSGRIFNLYNGAFITIALGIVLYIITKAVQL